MANKLKYKTNNYQQIESIHDFLVLADHMIITKQLSHINDRHTAHSIIAVIFVRRNFVWVGY